MSEFEDELVNFDPEEFEEEDDKTEKEKSTDEKKHVALTGSAFTDFLLKPELLRAVMDCGFEHPSTVQHECIPHALLGNDLICQAQSGMGKTAVFVLTVLQQIDPESKDLQCLVICHTRELAFQICSEFMRFTKYMGNIKTRVFFGGVDISVNRQILRSENPNIVVGTPGRIAALIKHNDLDVSKLRHFVVDEADKVFDNNDAIYRRNTMKDKVEFIFRKTPADKQVMMFSATFSEEMRGLVRKYMKNPHEILVDDETKLTLHGIQQFYCELEEREKNQKLADLLDLLEFNQIVIFVRSAVRARELNEVLLKCKFPSICIYGKMDQPERIRRYKLFKNFQKRILISTDLVGRGIDIQRVNIVINYDMPEDSDSYLHRVGRAGRFGTKGLAISFIVKGASTRKGRSGNALPSDTEILSDVQKRFMKEGKIKPLPEKIDVSSYMNN